MPKAHLPSERQKSGSRPIYDALSQHVDVELYEPRQPIKHRPILSDPSFYAGTPTRGDSYPTYQNRLRPSESSSSSRDSGADGLLARAGDTTRQQPFRTFEMPPIEKILRPDASAYPLHQAKTEAPSQHRNDQYNPTGTELERREKKRREGLAESRRKQRTNRKGKGKKGRPTES